MKRILFLVAALLTLVWSAPAMALTPHSPVLIQDDAAQPQTVKPGEEIFIALPSNISTGYAWTASVNDTKLLSYEGNVYQRRSAAIPGASGARSFETNAAPAKTLTFTITVE